MEHCHEAKLTRALERRRNTRQIDSEDYRLSHVLSAHNPKYIFSLNKSLHLFGTHCPFLPIFDPNIDLLQAVSQTDKNAGIVKVIDRPTQTPLCGFAVAAHEPLKFCSNEHIFERFSFFV